MIFQITNICHLQKWFHDDLTNGFGDVVKARSDFCSSLDVVDVNSQLLVSLRFPVT